MPRSFAVECKRFPAVAEMAMAIICLLLLSLTLTSASEAQGSPALTGAACTVVTVPPIPISRRLRSSFRATSLRRP
jgi:hypothetical protein